MDPAKVGFAHSSEEKAERKSMCCLLFHLQIPMLNELWHGSMVSCLAKALVSSILSLNIVF